ncbi:hypothetical protein ACA910_019725 [Epithemia clementina (nom. ined.)]
MNPLDEIKRLHESQCIQLQQMQEEMQDKVARLSQEKRQEPTLTFADIKEISEKEMNDTKASFQSSVWLIILHSKEWREKVSSNGIQHPKDIIVEKAVIEAEFRDNKILTKTIEQVTAVRTSPYFRQVGLLATVLEMYMKKGYHNSALQAYVDQGQVTIRNAHKMLVNALEKARKEADAEIKLIAEMESQETQDMWWQMYLSTLPKEDEEAKPIIVMKLNKMIHKWEQHLMNEIEVVGLRQEMQITEAVIQLIKYDQT